MLTLNKSCLKGNFKQNLWIEISSDCSGGLWSYSFSEKRLFIMMAFLTIFLMSVYFAGNIQEIKTILGEVTSLDQINSQKIYDLNNNPSPTPKSAYSQIQIKENE